MSKCTALLEDLSSIPRTHVGWLITSCNSSSRGSNTLSGIHGKLLIPPLQKKKTTKFFLKKMKKTVTYIHILLLQECSEQKQGREGTVKKYFNNIYIPACQTPQQDASRQPKPVTISFLESSTIKLFMHSHKMGQYSYNHKMRIAD